MKTKLHEQGNPLDRLKRDTTKTVTPTPVIDPDKEKKKEKSKTDDKKKHNFDNVGGLNARAAALKKHVLSMPEFSKANWSAIGGYANRNIGNTDVPSEHKKGNALDWHGAKGNLDPVMQKLADWLVANGAQFYVKNVIYNHMIWNYPKGWHTYEYKKLGGSPHTDHVHVDFYEGNLPRGYVDQIAIHKQVQRARWNLYRVLTKHPELYFQNFKAFTLWIGSGRHVGTDNEEAAADWLKKTFNEVWDSKFKIWEKTAHPYDISNMRQLRLIVKWAIQLIQEQRSGKYIVNFWNYDTKTKKWSQVQRSYYWDYL